MTNISYKITMIIEALDEDGSETGTIFKMSTDAGMADFEENIVRKGLKAIDECEGKMEAMAEAEADRTAEDAAEEEYYQATDMEDGKEPIDRDANTVEPM